MRHPFQPLLPVLPPRAAGTTRLRAPCRCFDPRWRALSREAQFHDVIEAYHRSGGVATGNEVAALVRPHRDQAVSTVARWIVARDVLSFDWRMQPLVPLFQFDLARMLPRKCVSEVLAELVDVFDNWDLARWFAEPNAWLGDRAPADLITACPHDVLDAARADRFVTRGC